MMRAALCSSLLALAILPTTRGLSVSPEWSFFNKGKAAAQSKGQAAAQSKAKTKSKARKRAQTHVRLSRKAMKQLTDQFNAKRAQAAAFEQEARVEAQRELQRSKTKHEACMCLNWKEEYKWGRVKCGMGAEHFSYSWTTNTRKGLANNTAELDQEFCKGPKPFFLEQDHNYCVRVSRLEGPGGDGGYWCYVSGQCKANRTMPVYGNSTRRAKRCKSYFPIEDKRLLDLQPSELFELARIKGISYHEIALMAYRTGWKPWTEGLTFEQQLDKRYENTTMAKGFVFNDALQKRVVYNNQYWIIYSDPLKFPMCYKNCG